MGRRLTSRRTTMRGGAWFKYSVEKDEDFKTDECNNETKKGNRLMKDIVIAKKDLGLTKGDIEKNTAEYNKLRTKPSKKYKRKRRL